jgi:SAM-dependent methyltransferase
VSRSEEISRAFYATLGADGLARRTRPDWDERIVEALVEILPINAHVLDVGCGYGRIGIPLARAGYAVEGLDLSPNLIEAARETAEAEAVDIGLAVGSMTALPYPARSFDAAICLWSAFHELLEDAEQVRAISEMWRISRPGGFALIEGPVYAEPTAEQIERGDRRGPEHRVVWNLVEGVLSPHYAHDEDSFRRICGAAGVSGFRVFERDWGGRRRLFLRLDKPASGAKPWS